MTSFPSEFADLLSAEGRRWLEGRYNPSSAFALDSGRAPADSWGGLVDVDKAASLAQLLEDKAWPAIRHMDDSVQELPQGSEIDSSLDYKSAPWSARLMQAPLAADGRDMTEAKAQIYEATGMLAMLCSDSLFEMVKRLTGHEVSLLPEDGFDVIAYSQGDYVGPHNDASFSLDNAWAEDAAAEQERSDLTLHLTFLTPGVLNQYVFYQQGRFLNGGGKNCSQGGLSIYELPFWHYSTPLQVEAAFALTARRWLVDAACTITKRRDNLDGSKAPLALPGGRWPSFYAE